MENGEPALAGQLCAILIAMGTASFVVTVYHLVILCCNQHQQRRRMIVSPNPSEQERSVAAASAPRRSREESAAVAHLIPAHKYERKRNKKKDSDDDVADEDEDVTCAVCLGDFVEGEEVKTLPECLHYFHVPCIDMWLCSHSSCPICRARTTPLPAVIHRSPEHGAVELMNNAHQSINVMQLALFQSSLGLGVYELDPDFIRSQP